MATVNIVPLDASEVTVKKNQSLTCFYCATTFTHDGITDYSDGANNTCCDACHCSICDLGHPDEPCDDRGEADRAEDFARSLLGDPDAEYDRRVDTLAGL